MQENDTKIVRIHNIFDFDFTGELGARYGGRDFVIPAGGSLLAPYTLADHLATHLARQSIIRKAPLRDGTEIDGKGTDRPLWSDQAIHDLKALILSDVYEEEKTRPQSQDELMAAKVEELNKSFTQEDVVPAATGPLPTEFKDKAEVIAELEKRGIAFNVRSTKANLEKLLTDAV